MLELEFLQSFSDFYKPKDKILISSNGIISYDDRRENNPMKNDSHRSRLQQNFTEEEAVYFGTTNIGMPQISNNEIKIQNQALINNNRSEDNEIPGRHFMIKYSFEHRTYILKDLGLGLGVFHKLDKSELVEDSIILHFGNSFFLITSYCISNNNIEVKSTDNRYFICPLNPTKMFIEIPDYFF
jgi:hypothetical protein